MSSNLTMMKLHYLRTFALVTFVLLFSNQTNQTRRISKRREKPLNANQKSSFNSFYSSTQAELEDIFINKTEERFYKKWVKPNGDSETKVVIRLDIYSVAAVDEKESEFSIQVLLDIEWHDDRLNFEDEMQERGRDEDLPQKVLLIEGGSYHVERIWTPALRIPLTKDPKTMETSNTRVIFMRVLPDGTVRIRKRLYLKFFCMMNFKIYPFDTQHCPLELVSSDLSTDFLQLNWAQGDRRNLKTDPVVIEDSFSLDGFKMKGPITISEGIHLSQRENFSLLRVEFHLERNGGQFILDVYLPTTLFVMMSWLSFWIEISQVPPRVILNMTTMLTLVTASHTARENLPRIAYANALDIWNIACVSFVFLAMIEFIIVSYIARTDHRRRRMLKFWKTRASASNVSLSTMSETQSSSGDSINTAITTTTTTDTLASKRNVPITPLKIHHSNHHHHVTFPFDVHHEPRNSVVSQLSEMSHGSIKPVLFSPPSTPTSPCFEYNHTNSNNNNRDVWDKSLFEHKMSPQELADAIDFKCRIFVPLSFVLFNVCYWATVLWNI